MAAFHRFADDLLQHIQLAGSAFISFQKQRGIAGYLAQAREDGQYLNPAVPEAIRPKLCRKLLLAADKPCLIDLLLFGRHFIDHSALYLIRQFGQHILFMRRRIKGMT